MSKVACRRANGPIKRVRSAIPRKSSRTRCRCWAAAKAWVVVAAHRWTTSTAAPLRRAKTPAVVTVAAVAPRARHPSRRRISAIWTTIFHSEMLVCKICKIKNPARAGFFILHLIINSRVYRYTLAGRKNPSNTLFRYGG